MNDIRIGYGYDVHRLKEGRPLILGGVRIEHSSGLDGHSDADVLMHAISDALLGALALGDIGTHFPDNDEKYRNIDSRILLREINQMLQERGYQIGNIDSTIVAEKPKLASHIPKMRDVIAKDLNIEAGRVSVKATTSEKMGFVGEEKGISARAAVLIVKS